MVEQACAVIFKGTVREEAARNNLIKFSSSKCLVQKSSIIIDSINMLVNVVLEIFFTTWSPSS